MNEDIVECPCYPICSGLGLEMKRSCRYRKSDLPPPGMHVVNPKDDWCPAGVQASVLMLAYMLSGDAGRAGALPLALARVRQWAQDIRQEQESDGPPG